MKNHQNLGCNSIYSQDEEIQRIQSDYGYTSESYDNSGCNQTHESLEPQQEVSNFQKKLLSQSNALIKHNKSSMNFEPKVVNGISLFPK